MKMNPAPTCLKEPPRRSEPGHRLSEEGRGRLLSRRGEPLFLAGWKRVLFIHFEVDATVLQREVPFPLDRHEGRAYVSLVAFTMCGIRPRLGGRVAAGLFMPVGTQKFLNVRTYVRMGAERGIYFIAEWLSSWLNVQLGPLLYGLPYHHAAINYRHRPEDGLIAGEVRAKRDGEYFAYESRFSPEMSFAPCEIRSRDEFLLERYTAYTARGSKRRFFRIWHPPWQQTRVPISIRDDGLPARTFPWFKQARWMGANYAPGFDEVWMGRAHPVKPGPEEPAGVI